MKRNGFCIARWIGWMRQWCGGYVKRIAAKLKADNALTSCIKFKACVRYIRKLRWRRYRSAQSEQKKMKKKMK